MFGDFDVTDFWEPSPYVGSALDDATVLAVERQLRYPLPGSYVEMMSFQNGGIPRKNRHRTKQRTTWSHDHIAITGLYSIGKESPCSLCGEYGSQFWMDEWDYPSIGIYFADCPSAGHDMLRLD